MSIVRPDWSGAALPAVVEQVHEERPTFTAEDLSHVQSGALDSQDEALSQPPMSLASVQRELDAIMKLRTTDPKTYRGDDAQKRQLALIGLREKLKAQSASERKEAGEYDGSALDPDLLDTWEKQGGVKYHLQTAQKTAQTALDALEPEEAEALERSFDALPASAQTSIFGFLAVEPGRWRPASDDVLTEFAESDVGDLVEELGATAANKLGVVRGRLNMMLRAMNAGDRQKAEAWLDSLSTQQARAVFLALAGGN